MVVTPASTSGSPQLGEHLGHYRIVRHLGGGGMGSVFEAEDLESGRRVALKLLSQALDSPEARERFFREGRLAASINHPNSVYVFGTEEIGGTPVIAMELVAGGTLEERVKEKGPMSSAEAVDAVQQIISGLEAAHRIGILHRDVKPSNCFVDADGTVKIGDFGLSISTATRAESNLTATGSFLGTPAFCSPEQLRGEELSARSDIYSLGATLFYLLTGRTPYEAKNVVALIATVLEQPAPSPRKFKAELPRGLARIVQRCLDKQPSDRFKSYEELRRALAAYDSAAPVAGTLGLRTVAAILDFATIAIFNSTGMLLGAVAGVDYFVALHQTVYRSLGAMLIGLLVPAAYFAVCEGFWGTTPGKRLCRLRVVGPNRNIPGLWRALCRALIFVGLPMVPGMVIRLGDPAALTYASLWKQNLVAATTYSSLALLFVTARRRNGFAAIHDLLTKTKVIARASFAPRPLFALPETPSASIEGKQKIGPYHVLETLESNTSGAWHLGYDMRLLRKVWIRSVPPATPPVPINLRNLGRPGRLRWLAGRRSSEENWDAYEAAQGDSLANVLKSTGGPNEKPPVQPWSLVRYWLYDLATELGAAEKDGTLPPVLSLDRIWIGSGQARLLDFSAPNSSSELPAAPTVNQPVVLPATAGLAQPRRSWLLEFLDNVASAALTGRIEPPAKNITALDVPLPLSAREFLLSARDFLDADFYRGRLQPLLNKVATVTRMRRLAVLAGCLAFPLCASLMIVAGTLMLEKWNQRYPGMTELQMHLQSRFTGNLMVGTRPRGPSDEDLGIYIANHYRGLITNQPVWTSSFCQALIRGEGRRFAEQSVVKYSASSEADVARAEAAVKPHLPGGDPFKFIAQPSFLLMVAGASLVLYVCVPAVVAALAFRGGLVLLLAGISFVRRNGERAGRLRLFFRALLVWAPLILTIVLSLVFSSKGGPWLTLISILMLFALTITSLALPGRGLADRLAGTWPVPR